MNRVLFLSVFVGTLLLISTSQAREWTTANGKLRFEAELFRLGPNHVDLRLKENGKIYSVPRKMLCAADREYLERVTPKPRAIDTIPPEKLAEIEKASKRKWSDPFIRKQMMEHEKKAYLDVVNYWNPSVPAVVLLGIFEKAEKDYPDDYNMQRFVIKAQAEAYLDLGRYKPSDVPANALKEIRLEAEKGFPGDYRVQLFLVQCKVDEFRKRSKKGR